MVVFQTVTTFWYGERVKADQLVKLKWPNPKPLEVKSARGRVAIPESGPKRTLEKPISLALVDAISNTVIAVTETENRGYFFFPTPNRGLYFIRLNHTRIKTWSGEEMTGDIPIEIAPDAISEGVDLDLGWSSCGLYYSDMKQCQQPEVTVSNMCGEVFDPVGAIIAKADVYLFRDEHDEVPVAEATSDARGRFSMTEVTPGGLRALREGHWLSIRSFKDQGFGKPRHVLLHIPSANYFRSIRVLQQDW